MKDFLNIPTYLSFDDIMIVPSYSDIKSRSEPITKTSVGSITLDLPIISSPMDTVTEYHMALAMSRAGGMGLIHRFMTPKEQGIMLNMIFNKMEDSITEDYLLTNTFGTVGAAIGVGDSEFERLKTIIDISGKDRFTTLAIDVANGFSSYMREMIDRVRSSYGEGINIIAGNIATGEGFDFLAKAGANAIRAGIGGGCFLPGAKVLTSHGLKTIETITIGDQVLTHTGSWKEVTHTMVFDRDEKIISINGISCTKNHEFYVIKKSDEKLITENNIHNYATWVQAEQLDGFSHLLIDTKFKLVEVKSKIYRHYVGKVYDLTVKDDHSYNVENIIVHNSICKTRIQTGIGVPTLSTVLDSARFKNSSVKSPSLIADGGIRYPGDFAKSIVAGADAIMVGRILAGSNESPGEINEGYKVYRGMACYSSDTEVLTSDGWKVFSNLSKNDKIATLNQQTKNIEYDYPLNLFSYKYSGDMYRVNSKFVDLLVTPNHNLYLGKRNHHRETHYQLIRADEAYSSNNKYQNYKYRLHGNWIADKVDSFTIPESNLTFKMDDWLNFYGFWLTKGNLYQYKQSNNSIYNVISISNSSLSLLRKYQNILVETGIKSSIRSKKMKSGKIKYELKTHNKYLFNYLSKFGKAKDKFISEEFKNLSFNQLNIILDSMTLIKESSNKSFITTASRKLADDISELCVKTQRNGKIRIEKKDSTNDEKSNYNYNLYHISVVRNSIVETFVHSKNVSIENYNGEVYCAELANSVICVRRDGKPVWCGNSKEVQTDKRGGLKPGTCAEGVSTMIECTGPVSETLQEFRGGLVSSMTYLNARNLEEYRLNAKLIRITSAGMEESHAFGTKK